MTQPRVMGIINATPDSFSGDGLMAHKDFTAAATAQASHMIADGADILDIGGESTRPGATPVTADEEIRRIVPVIAAIRARSNIPLSIDTFKAATAKAALDAGATIVNDITGLQGDPAMAALVAARKVDIVLMHNRGLFGGAQGAATYGDLLTDIMTDLSACVARARAAGIGDDKIILDPGVGFGKSVEQNLTLIARVADLRRLGFPILMGVSRKSVIGKVLDLPESERLEGTAACVTACVLGGADILRVHDVREMARVVKMAAALRAAGR